MLKNYIIENRDIKRMKNRYQLRKRYVKVLYTKSSRIYKIEIIFTTKKMT